ncbi:hypothetical protein THAOC_16402 [Thalassiosira oceanica]|uniref:RING-type domain-containing protein n=1 Tax=Thalassiosira oceanica TaxID=159749 RepID=K0SXH8_THAOC|nr:hypothetical protein THAOC_16402 [Thalassiosira oceanica]|eukprot:EJK62967.1 hypothetical protein THAOC_16402 [Thalassiosira oceanica]
MLDIRTGRHDDDVPAFNFASASASTRICGACEQEKTEGAYSREQWARKQSIRRCDECVDAGNQLVLMKKGRTRSEEDDCPICSLPLPLEMDQTVFKVCCMNLVCNGCIVAAEKRGMDDCPFCRAPTPDESQLLAMIQKRVDAGDPAAMWHLGTHYADGSYGLTTDVTRTVELYERAAKIGFRDAHCSLGCLYHVGTDVEKDTARAIRHYEAAAVKGVVTARHNLGYVEYEAGNYDCTAALDDCCQDGIPSFAEQQGRLLHWKVTVLFVHLDRRQALSALCIRRLAVRSPAPEATLPTFTARSPHAGCAIDNHGGLGRSLCVLRSSSPGRTALTALTVSRRQSWFSTLISWAENKRDWDFQLRQRDDANLVRELAHLSFSTYTEEDILAILQARVGTRIMDLKARQLISR